MAARRLPPLPTVKDILQMYNIKAKKNLSQNFIMDPRLLDRLALSNGPLNGKWVVEVGPGPGGITRSILGQGAIQCAVIEKDARFIPALNLINEACGGKLDIHIGDVLHFNMEKLFPHSIATKWESDATNVVLIGNLPFNVSTPLTIKWLQAMSRKESLWTYGRVPMTLCFQQEVAQRMSAPPGDLCRSRLSVMCQNWARVQQRFLIPGGAFVPEPDVNVGVVTLTPLTVPYIEKPYKLVEKVVTTVFLGKRKRLINTVKNLFPQSLSKALSRRVLSETGLSASMRPIDLDMSDWSLICNSYERIIFENPSLMKFHLRCTGPYISDGELLLDSEKNERNNTFEKGLT